MLSYLPFGKELVMSESQIENRENKFALYDTYGIPYGIIDDSHEGEDIITKKERDREYARLLIMQGEDLPEDLKMRLLKYKNQDIKQGNIRI